MNPFDSDPEKILDDAGMEDAVDEDVEDLLVEDTEVVDEEGRNPEEPDRLKRPKLGARKSLDNLIMPSALTLGVVTWNVAHFGEGELAALKALKTVRDQMGDFENAWSWKGKWNPDALAEQFVEYLDQYEWWESHFLDVTKAAPALKNTKTCRELERAEKRHHWVPGDKELDQEEDAEEGEKEETGEGAALKEGNADPEGLARMLGEQWKTYDERHSRDKWATQQISTKEWTGYFAEALARCGDAWKIFKLEWSQLSKEKDESRAQQAILDDMSSLVLSTKDLRAAVKMVLKPVLQLRERAKLANKVQAAAVKEAKKAKLKALDKAGEALDKAGEALDKARKVSQWKIGPLFTAVEALDKMLHRVLVAAHIDLMFRQNDWLDAVVLQEVNKGIDALEKYLDSKGYRCIRGFTLQSKSGKGSQTEYYPLVIRKDGRIQPYGLLAIFNDSGVIDNVGADESPILTWSKAESVFRPILAYDVRVQVSEHLFEPATIGVVHTSPAGREMSREKVFDQVDVPLRVLAHSSVPMVLGGDFYLTEEAVTVGWGSLGEEGQRRAEELKKEYCDPIEKRIRKLDTTIKKLDGAKSSKKAPKRKRPTNREEENIQREKNALLEQKGALGKLIDALKSDRVQLIRNDGQLAVSVGNRVRELGLEVAQPITGTNWKTKSVLSWFNAQIADFFVHTGPNSREETSQWTGARVGLVSPTGGLRVVDVEELWLSKYWRCASDHFPVGIVLTQACDQRSLRSLDLPFLDLGQHLTWGVRAEDKNTIRVPREVLGFTNPGNTCYVNAALQLLWRIDLQKSYVTEDPGVDLKAIVDEVNGILAIHQDQGQNGTYGAYGKDHFYTTAETLGLRAELTRRGATQGAFAQSDAGEALLKILEAFEHPVLGFSAGDQTHLALAVQNRDFAGKRPSRCHFITEVETRYALGSQTGTPQGNVLQVSDRGIATTYRCDNVLSLRLPEGTVKQVDHSGKEGKEEEEEEEEEAEPLAEATFEDLLRSNRNLDYGNDGDTKAVDTGNGHFPNAKALTESIEIAVPPDHWIVQLERFGEGGQGKKVCKVTGLESYDYKPLKGFIVHLGGSAVEGHYIAYLEHQGTWYCLNDDQVIENPPDLQAALEDAYILYYE